MKRIKPWMWWSLLEIGIICGGTIIGNVLATRKGIKLGFSFYFDLVIALPFSILLAHLCLFSAILSGQLVAVRVIWFIEKKEAKRKGFSAPELDDIRFDIPDINDYLKYLKSSWHYFITGERPPEEDVSFEEFKSQKGEA